MTTRRRRPSATRETQPVRAARASRETRAVRAARAVRAETSKLLSLPSLRWTVVLTWAATLVIALAARRAVPSDDPIRAALRWTQVGFLVFGVLAATQEYQDGGQIRATLLALPRRLPLLVAKAVAVGLVALVVAAPARTPYLIGVTLVGAALGCLLRNAVAAVATALMVYVVICPVLRARSPGLAAWLPDTALLDPSDGWKAAVAWPAVATVLAGVAFQRRDA